MARLFVSVLISFNLYGVHEECISSYNSERNSKVFRRVHYISIINMPISIRIKKIEILRAQPVIGSNKNDDKSPALVTNLAELSLLFLAN